MEEASDSNGRSAQLYYLQRQYPHTTHRDGHFGTTMSPGPTGGFQCSPESEFENLLRAGL